MIGEDHDNTQDEPGAVEKATGTIRDDTMAKPFEMIVSDRTDEINMPETIGIVSTHHATDGIQTGFWTTIEEPRSPTQPRWVHWTRLSEHGILL